MKALLTLLMAVVIVLAISAAILCADKSADTSRASATVNADDKKVDSARAERKPKVKQVAGEVGAVDAAARSITIKGRTTEVTLTAEEKLLKDVRVGDAVVVRYTEQDGKMTASSIKKAQDKKPVPTRPGEPQKK